MKELKIVATIVLKPKYQNDVLKALHNVVDATRKEEGNISYELLQNVSDNLSYTILESWKSQEAIDLHMNSAHFDEFKKAIDGKISDLQITTIKQVY